MKLHCTYFPALDRFAVTKNDSPVERSWFIKYKGYTSLEYLRYVPLDDVSFSEIHKFLLKYPQELCCEVTNACNAHCRVCIAEAPARTPMFLSTDVLAAVLKHFSNPISRITITGGEPTIHPDLANIIDCCASTGANVVLSINGYETLAIKNILDSSHVSSIAVSLHGPKDVHDIFMRCPNSYIRAIETIRLASKYSLPINILSTATHRSSGDTTLNYIDRS